MTSVNNLYQEIKIPAILNPQTLGELNADFLRAEKAGRRFIVLRGQGTVFCNGLDLKWVVSNDNPEKLSGIRGFATFLEKLQTSNAISISVVNGTVSGGGMGIVCASDFVMSVPKATFSLPEGLIGLVPGMILPSLLNRLSKQKVKKMVLTGKRYTAKTAYRWGITDKTIQVEETEVALQQAIKSMRSCKKESVSDLKQMLYATHLSKQELSQLGVNILEKRLSDKDVIERLRDIVEFME